jgi:hypothetical protein
MAAKPLRGIDGVFKVKKGSSYTEVAYTDSWSIPFSVDTQEITKLNATAKEYIRGLSGATLSASGTLIWDDTAQQLLIQQFMDINNDGSTSSVMTGSLQFTGVLQKGDAGASDPLLKKDIEVQCDVIPTGFSIETSAGGTPKWKFDGTVTGSVVFKITTKT